MDSLTVESFAMECGHKFHRECLADHIEYLIENREIKAEQFVCPENDCNVRISERILRRICTESVLNKYFDFIVQDAIIKVQGRKRVDCPCGKFFLVDERETYGDC